MKRHRNHALEDLSIATLRQVLPSMWVVHPFHNDYGIDVQIEIFEENGNSTGLRIYGQLKATDKSEEEDVLELDRQHFEYWAAHTDPVALFRFFAGSHVIKWCWMHDLEWRMRPLASSLDVSSHLTLWHSTESPSAVIRLAQLRAEVIHQRLVPPISISVSRVGGGLAHSLELADCLAKQLPPCLFEVFGEASSQCHFDVILNNKRLYVGHLGLPGYLVTAENKGSDETADLIILLIFLIAVRYDRTLLLRGIASEVIGTLFQVADGSLMQLAFEGLMGALGVDRAVPRILEQAPNPEDPFLWFSLISAGMRASHRYGQVEFWLWQLKSWADAPLFQDMSATAAYNYANSLANAGLGQWEEATRYYLLASERDSTYHDREYFWSELGATQFEAGKFDEAIASYRQALKIRPSAATQWRLGDAMFHIGNYKAAYSAIAQAVSSEESLGAYPLLVMELCGELVSRWHIEQQVIAPVDSAVHDQLITIKPVDTEGDLIAALGPFMGICAVDTLLSFNAGHMATQSKQPQVATYRYLACALRQRNDAEAWALALVSALDAKLDEFVELIAKSAYFYTGEALTIALMNVLSFPSDASGEVANQFKRQLIDLVRSTKAKEEQFLTLRIHGGNRTSVSHVTV